MGQFITFEGIEGCGKTTQIKLLADQLAASGLKVVLTREPGGCNIANKIRNILLDADNQALTPLAELLLYAAARAQHVSEIIIPAMTEGSVVLCDRFTDATVAYQSAGRGIPRESIDILNDMACQGIRPDLTILIDCDPVTGLGRAKRRMDSSTAPREERFELEGLEFHRKVREAYLLQAEREPRRFLTVDGNLEITGLSSIIYSKVSDYLERRGNGLC